ncbi:response regulator [Gephyromycinifex aptenodytis]|uniref:response regulator n=1 Tax=Gephyromycinifex aptenodytis TaxID=2716227 RepID=UPI001444A2FD|nr:response regulator transcription factor [Gephyromycinifex aptenodytis]
MSQQSAIRVVIVDDDPLVRSGLRLILGGATTLEIVGEACDGIEAITAVQEFAPDVVLMDVRMPRRDGISATRLLLQQPHPPRILVLTTFDADDLVIDALRSGASGFLLKDTPPPAMIAAIEAVARGEQTLSPSVVAQVVKAATRDPGAQRRQAALSSLAALTEREHEVALAVARGASNAQIAAELFMSVATVKAHVSHIFAKLEVDNRVQIAIRVHDAELC